MKDFKVERFSDDVAHFSWRYKETERERGESHSLFKSLKMFFVKKNLDHFWHPLNENTNYSHGWPLKWGTRGNCLYAPALVRHWLNCVGFRVDKHFCLVLVGY